MDNPNFLATRSTIILSLLCALLTIAAPAQTFTNLADLTVATGDGSFSPLIQGFDGNLYGTTSWDGAYGGGTFIKVTPSGIVTNLYDFCANSKPHCPDGSYPSGAVALGPDGNFYGTTQGGLDHTDHSTIYKISPLGALMTLHTFCASIGCPDGAFASRGLTLARNGDFYGTSYPMAGNSAFNNLVFKISSSGQFTPLLTVCPSQTCPTNAGPSGTFLQASGGYLIAPGPGGVNGMGAIYRMTQSGTPTVIYSFCDDTRCHDGFSDGATSPLVQTSAGNLLGTDFGGGLGSQCINSDGCGTAFRVEPAGATLTKLHDFCSWPSCNDGGSPSALIQATDGNFYGTTELGGGTDFEGTVFKLTPGGHFTVVHTFSGLGGSVTAFSQNGDWALPGARLLQATDGNLYGTTPVSIFRISLGLAPFIKTVQNAGKIGATVIILGTNLTGATSVTFNGVAAAFTVVSHTRITATVPAGATSGSIQVVTPRQTLKSNIAFVVLP